MPSFFFLLKASKMQKPESYTPLHIHSFILQKLRFDTHFKMLLISRKRKIATLKGNVKISFAFDFFLWLFSSFLWYDFAFFEITRKKKKIFFRKWKANLKESSRGNNLYYIFFFFSKLKIIVTHFVFFVPHPRTSMRS